MEKVWLVWCLYVVGDEPELVAVFATESGAEEKVAALIDEGYNAWSGDVRVH